MDSQHIHDTVVSLLATFGAEVFQHLIAERCFVAIATFVEKVRK